MNNITKYLLMLENLKFPSTESSKSEESSTQENLAHNLPILQKYVKYKPKAIINFITEKHIQMLTEEDWSTKINTADVDNETLYIIYMEYVLLEILENINFNSDAKEDLISTRHTNLCIECVQNLSARALRSHVHSAFLKTGGFFNDTSVKTVNYALLQLSIGAFERILQIRQFHAANAMELVLRDYMAAIYTLFLAHYMEDYSLEESYIKCLQTRLDFIWSDLSKVQYFRNILLLKSTPQLHVAIQKKLHQELLQKLICPDGFTTLVATLQIAQAVKSNQLQRSSQQTFEIIARIVAHGAHTVRFQHIMIRQIFKFCSSCVVNEAMLDSMGAGLLTLRRLYELRVENQLLIKQLLNAHLSILTHPADLLSGLILMEHQQFVQLISLLYQLFCTSVVECLPSVLLIDYLPLLMQLYYNIPKQYVQNQQIASLTLRCLHNRSTEELHEIIEKLYNVQYAPSWQQLHERVLLVPNIERMEMVLKIAPATCKQDFNISLAIPELLMQGDFHTLTYRIFMQLLRMMPAAIAKDTVAEEKIDLLQDEQELLTFLNSHYALKVEIVLSLNSLVSHQPLLAQIAANLKEFLALLSQQIEQRLKHSSATVQKHSEYTDQTLLIMLTLLQELLENASNDLKETLRSFTTSLQQLQNEKLNLLVRQRIATLLTLLNGDSSANVNHNTAAYSKARALIEAPESHLQVYGIQMLLDLLRRKDAATISNSHAVIALALTTLKSKESYTFLNCVRLFVVLVNIMQAEVLDVLSDEYLNDHANMDYRLVVGEAMIKVSKELGPLCYNYKQVLLNCFMHGARSPLNEFRMSSYANLAQICRTLSYQVHQFFQELLNLIDGELTTGQYLPAKRAAVLVLSELLDGMDSLFNFEEMLLPIYRLLKAIESSEHCDEKMRIHAANGLKALATKCKNILFPEQQLQKEIKIFGIKDKQNTNVKKHILEMD